MLSQEKTEFLVLSAMLNVAQRPILLLEGSRDVPLEVQSRMEKLAGYLMQTFPHLIARTGNAKGSDQAWARGVNWVAPERLQLILPVPNYQKHTLHGENDVLALNEANPDDFCSAKNLSRQFYTDGKNQGAAVYDRLPDYKKNYLERDALKVLGPSDYSGNRAKATAALFYLNPKKKNGGGTGHTLRLCEAKGVPYFLAEDWLRWLL